MSFQIFWSERAGFPHETFFKSVKASFLAIFYFLLFLPVRKHTVCSNVENLSSFLQNKQIRFMDIPAANEAIPSQILLEGITGNYPVVWISFCFGVV